MALVFFFFCSQGNSWYFIGLINGVSDQTISAIICDPFFFIQANTQVSPHNNYFLDIWAPSPPLISDHHGFWLIPELYIYIFFQKQNKSVSQYFLCPTKQTVYPTLFFLQWCRIFSPSFSVLLFPWWASESDDPLNTHRVEFALLL